jgi:carboxypeptidase A4
LYQIIAGYMSGETEIVKILDTYEFYLIPFINPDGFIHTQTTERLWRKNRQPRRNETCIGTDLNRNWPQNWALPGGASDDPCSQTYRGLSESDTPEVTSLTKHVLATADAHPGGIKWFVDWHSYGQLVLLPYGHDCDARAYNHEYQMELGEGIVDTIEAVNGTQYIAGPNCETLYPITGGSADFVFDNADAEVSWLIELRPNGPDGGGFILPPELILPTVTEMWEGVRWVLGQLLA